MLFFMSKWNILINFYHAIFYVQMEYSSSGILLRDHDTSYNYSSCIKREKILYKEANLSNLQLE
jgi:hypothetical protein